MNYNTSVSERFRQIIQKWPALSRLILINVSVWFILALVQLAGFLIYEPGAVGDQILLNKVLSWIAVPSSFQLLLSKPWTIITYMFVQEGFWHLFFNMIWLYWFGTIFLQFIPGKKIYILYLFGGLAGAFIFIIAFNVFPVFLSSIGSATAIGASAAVLAVTVATAILVPEYTVNLLFIGSVKIKYIAIFTVILDLLMIRSGNAGGHFAHLGGALAGLIYTVSIKNNVFNKIGVPALFAVLFKKKGSRHIRKVYSSERPLTDEEYNKKKAESRKKMDEILDKISRSGYSSLSSHEKEFLFKSSNK